MGLFVADLYVKGWKQIPRGIFWDAISIPLWYFAFWLPFNAFRLLGPLVLPILFVGAFKGPIMQAVLRSDIVCTIGGMCYSIYLTHRTTLLLSQILLGYLHIRFTVLLTLSLLVAAPASIMVGAVYFALIERPCMDPRWPQALVSRIRSRFNVSPTVPAGGE